MATFGSNYISTIQPYGDSIMQGTGATALAGMREPLYNLAAAAGVPRRIRFVGSQTTTPGGLTVNPNHEGHSGWVVKSPAGSGGGSLTDLVGTGFFPYDPDIVLLAGGTNDIDPAVNNDSAATLATSWGTYLDKANAYLSRSWQQIVALNLLKRLDATDSKAQAFNALVGGVISGKPYASRVWLVDVYAAIPSPQVGVNMADNVHPNDTGYTAVASVIWASSNFQSALAAARPRAVLP